LADLLGNSAALLAGDLGADLLGHLPGNVATLLLWHLQAVKVDEVVLGMKIKFLNNQAYRLHTF
jgi:hypothetical protein